MSFTNGSFECGSQLTVSLILIFLVTANVPGSWITEYNKLDQRLNRTPKQAWKKKIVYTIEKEPPAHRRNTS